MRSTICSTEDPRSRTVVTAVFAAATVCVAVLAGASERQQTPSADHRWQPDAGDVVVASGSSPATAWSELARSRAALRDAPDDPLRAANYALAALKRYTVTGDGRLVGFADTALAPWRSADAPPPDIWRLRARILQNRHRFTAAAEDLEALLEQVPRDTEARLLAADAWRRAGRPQESRGHCLALGLAGETPYAALCAAELAMSKGDYAAAAGVAARVAEQPALPAAALGWAYALAGDAAMAQGSSQEAARRYARSVRAYPALPVALAHADALIAAGRLGRASRILDAQTDADAVELRRAIVHRLAGRPLPAATRARLDRVYGSTAKEGTDVHYRERAMYLLDVLEKPAEALRAAEKNWSQQKGWEDAELLRRAALAAGKAASAAQVAAWRQARFGTEGP